MDRITPLRLLSLHSEPLSIANNFNRPKAMDTARPHKESTLLEAHHLRCLQQAARLVSVIVLTLHTYQLGLYQGDFPKCKALESFLRLIPLLLVVSPMKTLHYS